MIENSVELAQVPVISSKFNISIYMIFIRITTKIMKSLFSRVLGEEKHLQQKSGVY